MLIDNGERLVINENWEPQTIMEHLHRYQFTKELVQDHYIVLDAACGTGYGSRILAEKAAQVYGIDISEDAIQYASENYIAENINFQTMSVEKLDFPDNFFDLIVSFETIEHVEHEIQIKFLAEIKRCLKPTGVLIMSTPNDELYRHIAHGQYDNPFHISEFTKESFKSFLSEQFRHIEFYYQDVTKASSIFREGTVSVVSNGCCETPVHEEGRYYVAICSNKELKIIPGNHVYVPHIASYYKNEFFSRWGFLVADIGSGWDGRYSVRSRSCEGDYANFSFTFLLEHLHAPTIQALRFDPCYTSCRVTIKRATADGKPCKIHPINASTTLCGEDFFYTPNPMYQIEAEDLSCIRSITLQGRIEEIPLADAWNKMEASVHERDELQIKRDQLQAEYDKLQAEHGGLQAEHSGLEAKYDRLQAEHSGLQTGYAGLSERLTQSEQETMKALTDTERSLSQLSTTLLLREMAYWDRVAENRAMTQQIASLQGQVSEFQNAYNECQSAYSECQDAYNKCQSAYQSILVSRSWKITHPLRSVSRAVRKLREKLWAKPQEGPQETLQENLLPSDIAPANVPEAPCPPDAHMQGAYRILLVSFYCPSRAHAGGLRVLDLYRHIKNDFANVELTLFTIRHEAVDWGYDELDSIFDFVYFAPSEDLSLKLFQQLAGNSVQYDVVDFQFGAAADDLLSYRQVCNRILFTPMELMTEALFDEIKRSPIQDRKQWLLHLDWAITEINSARNADYCVCVSKPDADFLTGVIRPSKIVALETCLSETEFPVQKQETLVRSKKAITGHTLLYVAYFGSQTNQEALKWFLTEVHPKIKKEFPDYHINIVGRGDISGFRDLYDENTNFIGAVDSLERYIQDASAAIAPAFFGSGFRGKINQYALYGVPCVATILAARGLAYVENKSILVTDDPLKYAEYCIALLSDQALNQSIGEAAHSVCMSNYIWASKQELIASIYGLHTNRPAASGQ